MFQIVKRRAIWYAVSGILVGVSILSTIFFGFNQSIDFTGGSLWEIKTSKSLSVDEVRTFLSGYVSGDIVVQPVEQGLIMRFKTIDEETHQKIYADFTQKFGMVVENRFESIGPVIGQELKKKSTISVILVAIAIILYVAWAFRKVSKPVNSWTYGIVTIISLLHDVMIPMGLFAILGKFFNVEIGASFIAAILTIAGYSVNDTIVVLDRVRENLTRDKGDFEEIVEKSVHQTIARSLNTTVTTLLAMVAVYFFGGETVKYFALALIVGIAFGAYSSIFIASPLLITWYKRQYK